MNANELSSPLLVMIGAGGHAKVLHALALAAGYSILGVCDPLLVEKGETHWREVPVLGSDDALKQLDPLAVGLINGIGQIVGSKVRQDLYKRLRQVGFSFPSLVHPSAWVASTARLAQGVQVMAGAIVQPDCSIGENTIVNTCASVDHDCNVGANVHICPGATLCGDVCVHDSVFIGSGAILTQGLIVGIGGVVGAGATLTHNLDSNQILLGPVPRLKKQ
jgi:sugar O-acyltransferase (sialic acid O-acetyltransferase NeuD family)